MDVLEPEINSTLTNIKQLMFVRTQADRHHLPHDLKGAIGLTARMQTIRTRLAAHTNVNKDDTEE